MPELPDVEAFKKYLDSTSLHKKITSIEINTPDILKDISTRKLKSRLEGREFRASQRHGKYLLVELTGGNWLVMHFGMTGFLKYFKNKDAQPDHTRALFGFGNGYYLAYDCQRKLGLLTLVEDADEFIEKKELGPDAMAPDFDFEVFKDRFAGKASMAKTALMDQATIAGIGNVYSDEILFQSKVHPKKPVKYLGDKALKKLYRSMRRVLRTAANRRAEPERFPSSYLTRHRYANAQCPRCGHAIKTVTVSGRTAYYCPACQKKSE
jgi:formamidopyrimidine-DNA glycosylase